MKKLIIFLITIIFINAKIIKDSLGREVNMPEKVNKIVAIGPGALRMVVYLKSQNKVVGIEFKEKKFMPYARPYIAANKFLLKLPVIGVGGPNPNPNLEKIISIKPDVIIAGYINKSYANLISKKTGIPVFVITYGNIGNFANKKFFNSIKALGKVLNKEKRANDVINFINDMQKDLENRKININKKVYIGAVAFKGLHSLTTTISKFPPFEILGIKNVISKNIKSPFNISLETLYKVNPDIIFIDESGLKLVKKELFKYKNLQAFKQHQTYGILPYNLYMTNIGTAYLDTYFIGKVLDPQKFKDIDIEKKADEIYTFLVGKNVYPLMTKKLGGLKKLELLQKN
ncbi:iron ABC transporter substrate-binding protein [Caminibacter mediatlanticus TB-2]|uniref:Iron ABC transporter substrate-binding protein n=1 Tax=Caminibacter mediatlanticus TB-2 TaxID=391592 RepID=A0ABX5V833_9BACT|nr:iron ABC transporter substrate-binding protein [Caminibacter mediatlanticus]QCT94442.1 iron ABC transporter substrate-binding protein [Caminibacter mediatlanticus TB-2]